MKKSDFQEDLEKCMNLLNENLETLIDLENQLTDEKEDKLISDIQLHHLYNMTEDITESSKIKNAESSFMRRQMEHFDSG